MQELNENLISITGMDVLSKLPDPFIMDNGERLTNPSQWSKRREELYKTVIELQYGIMPPAPDFLEIEKLCSIYNGTFSCRITTGTRENPVSFLMTVLKPEGKGPYPAVVDGDMCFKYPFNDGFARTFTDNGVMLVLFNRTELAPDLPKAGRSGQLYRTYPDKTFGALGAWAWGYSRCVDALEKLGIADMDCIAFTGHSRGGKTAALAGALDERAAIVNPNATCAGACSCYRIHMKAIDESGKEERSETLRDLVDRFDFWVGPELKKYADNEAELPFDAHELKAMIAPRVLLISEGASDIWANPVGSWQTTIAAREVYRFLGAEEKLVWYFRKGFHYHSIEDIGMLVNVIKHFRNGEPLSDGFFKLPFKPVEPIFEWKCPSD